MKSRWSNDDAAEMLARHSARWGEDLALRTYSSRLIGAESSLVLHGGGNTSVKTTWKTRLGETIEAICVKASGHDLATIGPEGHAPLDLARLLRHRSAERPQVMSDADMIDEFRTHLLASTASTPSLETFVHAFIPAKFVDHTHPDAVLALTNQSDAERLVREALGGDVIILPYVEPGFALARAAAAAYDAHPDARAMIWLQHGIVTWGDTCYESYTTMLTMVSRAERYLLRRSRNTPAATKAKSGRGRGPSKPAGRASRRSDATRRFELAAPLLRGALSRAAGGGDALRPVVLLHLANDETLDFVDSSGGRALALTPPLTSDHLIRCKPSPMWIDAPDWNDPARLLEQIEEGVSAFASAYETYFTRNAARHAQAPAMIDPLPRVILMPGLGAVCAGSDSRAAGIVRDITEHTLGVKIGVARFARATRTGGYSGLAEDRLFDMEYRGMQQAKLSGPTGSTGDLPLAGHISLVTGAAGAIGSGICRELLDQGSHVVATDLPGAALDSLVAELASLADGRVIGVAVDVTDPRSVARGIGRAVQAWGGLDLVVVNAGLAHVSPLATMDLEEFRRLERVNVEGTLLVISESARLLERQGVGGDIVLISTKNVFAPGASFGAYSATKAAAHQLARIASLELAPAGIRVNMVAPDAVFSEGGRKSGLWAEVGPDRMRARGLDEKGLEEYYRDRNLLKATVTARHVAKAVLFFATRQTPTTGATIPVDGGLPDATPR